MGYSHYWTRSLRDLDLPVWERFTHDVERILFVAKSIASLTADGDSLDPPIVSDLRIQFNGFSSDGCEPLIIGRLAADDADRWDFCKTRYRPYDAAVTAVLLSFARHFREVKLGGEGRYADWWLGQTLHYAATGIVPDIDLNRDLEGWDAEYVVRLRERLVAESGHRQPTQVVDPRQIALVPMAELRSIRPDAARHYFSLAKAVFEICKAESNLADERSDWHCARSEEGA